MLEISVMFVLEISKALMLVHRRKDLNPEIGFLERITTLKLVHTLKNMFDLNIL